MNKTIKLFSIITICFATSTFADSKTLTPGKWEHSYQMKTATGQLEAAIEQARQAMASIPPEQREMMERMMKARGIDMNFKSYTATFCVTPEEAKNKTLPKPAENCSQSVVEETSNGFKVSYNCSGNPPVSGEGEMIVIDDKNYTITATINIQMNNKPETMNIEQKGKWLGAQCDK